MLPIQMRLCSPVDRGRKRGAPAGPIDRLAQGPPASLRAGRPGSLYIAGADLKPVGLDLRVFLLPSSGAAICWLFLSGPCFRDATDESVRAGLAAAGINRHRVRGKNAHR